MIYSKAKLAEELKSCELCKNKYGLAPFFFPMENQEVMLITACPSFQAVYKPLTSVRFFRTLCIALFGEHGISEEAIMQFQTGGNIYWTHYHKCYYEDFFKDRQYKRLPDTCYKHYISEEIRLLSPKLIIVLGKTTVQKMLKYTLKKDEVISFDKDGAKYVYTDFPDTGDEERFEQVRSYLKQYITFSRNKPYNIFTPRTVNARAPKHTVHLDFELEAVIKYAKSLGTENKGNRNNVDVIKTSDQLWYEQIIVPNLKRYSITTFCYLFMENQIKTFLFDVFSEHNNSTENTWRIIERFRKSNGRNRLTDTTIGIKDVIESIENGWRKLPRDYLRFMIEEAPFSYLSSKRELLREYDRLFQKIDNLREIRNTIVHQNGFISQAGIKTGRRGDFQNFKPLTSKFDGIKIFVNMVYVTEKGCDEVVDLVKKLVDFIKRIEKQAV